MPQTETRTPTTPSTSSSNTEKSGNTTPNPTGANIWAADRRFPLNPVIPNIREWPIHKLTHDANAFRSQLIESVREKFTGKPSEELREILEKTVYLEKIRLTRKPWSVDPPNEKAYWASMAKRLTPVDEESVDEQGMLTEITTGYAREIQGSFRIAPYKFAEQVLPFTFNRLLNATGSKNFNRIFGNRLGIHDRVKLVGEIDTWRDRVRKDDILIAVPTHFSNLDAILLGYSLNAIGLPAFIYGAGLNLFSAKILAWFMNRLGAYKVDRRKKNQIYLETLKGYSAQAMLRGCHSLFFPGGTRSRSGSIESRLKYGLLGTAVEAQRKLIEEANGGPYKRLVICPIVMSYHFVLEAPVLIKDHLQQVGRERFYVEQDRFSTSTKIARFLFKFFTKGSDIFVHFGAPMDVLGNRIDEEGRSVDDRGNPISLRAYFQRQGELQEDEQRDFEYTRRLGDRVLDSYYKQNIVLSSHVVAFAAHRLLEKRYPQLDLYQRLRLPEEDRVFSLREISAGVERLVSAIKEMRAAGKLNAEPVLDSSIAEIIKHGIKNLGIYHDKRALRFSTRKELRRNRRNGKGKGLEQEVHSEDLSLLYFYHNRLEGYGLEQYV